MSHRPRVGWRAVAILITTAGAGPATQPATRSAPPSAFAGPVLPTPPRQHDAWPRPATTLLAVLVDDTALLFDQGMADPRGCEYRAVGVVTGDAHGKGSVTDTHAWVIPATAPSAPRFAVCWNGLVYPCVTVGDKADLATDVNGLLDADRKERAEWKRSPETHDVPFSRGRGGGNEAAAIAPTSVLPIKACLLLRVGKMKLAEAYWPVVADDARPRDDHGGIATPDYPYAALSKEWAWYAFDRAVRAHMRGDDVVSRDTAKLLAAAVPEIESTDAVKKFDRPTHADNDNRKLVNAPYVASSNSCRPC